MTGEGGKKQEAWLNDDYYPYRKWKLKFQKPQN